MDTVIWGERWFGKLKTEFRSNSTFLLPNSTKNSGQRGPTWHCNSALKKSS